MSELDALHYHRHSSIQHSLGYELIESIRWQGDEAVVDIGCGEGSLTAEMARRVPQGRVVGIDPSPSMISLAKTNFKLPNLTFAKQKAEDYCHFHFAGKMFMLSTLHWIRDPKKAVYNMAQTLKPKGELFIITHPHESPYWRFLEEVLEEKRWEGLRAQSALKTMKTAGEYRDLLTAEGLIIEEMRLEEKIALYKNEEALSAYIQGWLPCFVSIPETSKSDFLQCTVKAAIKHSKEKESIQLPYSQLTIKVTS